MKQILIIVSIALALGSCVVNKKYQYLQQDDVNVKKDEFQKDSVLRKYKVTDYNYYLQTEDILSIQFYSLTPEEYDFFALKSVGASNQQFASGGNALVNGYLIDENGEVEFPIVGKIKLAGLTIFEAQNKIQQIAIQHLQNPVVEARLLNFRYTLLGEVNSEGVYHNFNNRISILEAIGLSGGFTDFADKANVKIIRQNNGISEVYYLNLLDEDVLTSEHFYLNQLDVIVVPPLKQRPYQVYFGKNLSLVISSISLLLIVIGIFNN